MDTLYYKYSDYLKKRYGCKVYKIPINISVSCPNRDGNLSFEGCYFCSEIGAADEGLDVDISIKEQIRINKEYIGKKYKANKFIVYFQSFTNTYLKMEDFKRNIELAIDENIVELAISTRPDCISEEHLIFLKEISIANDVNITIELGLQSCNYKTLNRINRGHTLAEFINAVMKIKKYGFHICTHIILNFPWDEIEDCIECSKILSSLKIDSIKIHSLAIIKNTVLADQFTNGEFQIITKDEYLTRLIYFLEYLDPEIVIQRLFGRIPEENTLFSNWNNSWRKLNNELDEKMIYNNSYQGMKFNYLDCKVTGNININRI